MVVKMNADQTIPNILIISAVEENWIGSGQSTGVLLDIKMLLPEISLNYFGMQTER